jgi:hypothetical protein
MSITTSTITTYAASCILNLVCRKTTNTVPNSIPPTHAADVEFGRIQARDLLQHLLTGPISNAPVDIVRVGSIGACKQAGCLQLTAVIQRSTRN